MDNDESFFVGMAVMFGLTIVFVVIILIGTDLVMESTLDVACYKMLDDVGAKYDRSEHNGLRCIAGDGTVVEAVSYDERMNAGSKSSGSMPLDTWKYFKQEAKQ